MKLATFSPRSDPRKQLTIEFTVLGLFYDNFVQIAYKMLFNAKIPLCIQY